MELDTHMDITWHSPDGKRHVTRYTIDEADHLWRDMDGSPTYHVHLPYQTTSLLASIVVILKDYRDAGRAV
jgi:poly(3-hydroxybutyrate) depolymerase